MSERDPNSRRRFLQQACGSAALYATGAGLLRPAQAGGSSKLPAHPARWYRKLPLKRVECQLCPKRCRVDDTERGFCGVRENRGGSYHTLVWGRPCSMNMDPIEKKPLFHLLPASWTFSIATVGCNMDCRACQNWRISQSRPEQVRSHDMPPARVVQAAKQAGSTIVSYTYTEPIVFLEYVIDTARLARAQGLRNCMITGGNVEVAPLKEALAVLDAVKVDLKAFSEATYVQNKGRLKPILRTIETVRKSGRWLEIVYLVIPTINDSEKEVRQMCRWVKGTVGKDVPVHFTRFHPAYQLKHLPPTPHSTLDRCYRIARAEGLVFPYVGNVVGRGGEDTRCPDPKCGKTLVERRGYSVRRNLVRKDGTCPDCGARVPGIWS